MRFFLKGLNRPYFERLLKRNIENALKELPETSVKRGEGRFYVSGLNGDDFERAVSALKKVFWHPFPESGNRDRKNQWRKICQTSAGPDA